MAPTIWAIQYMTPRVMLIRPVTIIAKITAGLMWPPEIAPMPATRRAMATPWAMCDAQDAAAGGGDGDGADADEDEEGGRDELGEARLEGVRRRHLFHAHFPFHRHVAASC